MSEQHEQSNSTTRPNQGPSAQELSRAIPPLAGGREVVVGIFVLIGIISVFLVLFLLTDPATFRGRYMVATEVTEAGGIRRGDPVQMRGVNIGRVHQFALSEEGVVITLEVNGEWEIPVDSHTRLVSAGLLGGRTVEVVPGDSPEMAGNNTILPGETVEDFFTTAEVLGGQAKDIMGRMQEALSDSAVASVEGSIRELEALLTTLSAVARSQETELLGLTRTLRSTAESLGETAETAGPNLASAASRADSALIQVQSTAGTLDEAAASLRVILARMEAGDGTLGRLSEDPSLYVNLSRAAESAHLLLEDLRENPSRYINLRIF
ncbi:MAG: MlaD family protein [Gemmatimonadota bacterium]